MGKLSFLRAFTAAAVALAGLAVSSAATAVTDPPRLPRGCDAIGVGDGVSQYLLDALSHKFNSAGGRGGKCTAKPQPLPYLYSWDATDPGDPAVVPSAAANLVTADGCAPIARPDGSTPGIADLRLNAKTQKPAPPGYFCIDFVRSARPSGAADPPCRAAGANCFVRLAGDAVTWASRSAAAGGTDAPANLTTAELAGIYTCQVNNWAQVGGNNAPIHPFLPQPGSGLREFFLAAIGVAAPGACVSDDNSELQENEGVNAVLNDPDAIVPYSVANYLAQVYRSAPCAVAACTTPPAPACKPAGAENIFGCDLHGVLQLNEINGTAPAIPWPLPAPPVPPAINKAPRIDREFTATFDDPVYDVVRYDPTGDHITPYLRQFFSAAGAARPGWICTNKDAQVLIEAYGFLVLPNCGTIANP